MVAAGEALLDPAVTKRLIDEFVRQRPRPAAPSSFLTGLTPREVEVLALVAEGLSNTEIADRLVVGDQTVKTHVSRVLAKLGLRDRTQAVISAYESGLVVPRSAPQSAQALSAALDEPLVDQRDALVGHDVGLAGVAHDADPRLDVEVALLHQGDGEAAVHPGDGEPQPLLGAFRAARRRAGSAGTPRAACRRSRRCPRAGGGGRR